LNPKEFFGELKRRKVYTIAIAYIVGAWALAQGIAQVFPVFDIPNWVVRLIVILIALGFPAALVLAWFFDLTRYGIVRTPDLDHRIMAPAVGPDRAQSSERSIAVLPFRDLSPNRDHDYLSDGIAEEILTALSKIDNLHVAARRSAFWFKGREADLNEIADKLNVENVLEGTVRRDGDRIRVTAELINACDGFTMWSETFEREIRSIFALQDEITRSIVEALKLKLAISPPPSRSHSTDAYDAYLQGLFYSDKSTEESLRKSLEFSTGPWTRIRVLAAPGLESPKHGSGWQMPTFRRSRLTPRCAKPRCTR
jgi:adenylate cyclase